ncbi:ABC transporter ATP-binding protein [Micromonospora sp. M12]
MSRPGCNPPCTPRAGPRRRRPPLRGHPGEHPAQLSGARRRGPVRPAAQRPRSRPSTEPGGRSPAVEVRGLTFGYGPHARPVLRNFSLTLTDRDHLAVVGPSGASKSTLASLMAGLLPPQAGTVHLAGATVTEVEPAVLARMRVLVPQEAYVFTGSLADNLRYLRPDADDHTLEVALDALGARPWRPAWVAWEHRWRRPCCPPASGNSSRRSEPGWPRPLVVLDEATCHLDPALEATVEAAFARRPGSLVVIAHRISSALRAGRVLVLDGDEPVLGTHEQLLARSATYRVLVGCWDDSMLPSRTESARQG